tara:strand:+ start:279 stop:434 length:156 start_codon:yes stop_codon:yes gene_type:complete
MTKFTSNAARRRFILSQEKLHDGAPEKLLERWRLFIDITEEPVTFKTWVCR